jgi:hypothetical protein
MRRIMSWMFDQQTATDHLATFLKRLPNVMQRVPRQELRQAAKWFDDYADRLEGNDKRK